MASRAIARPAEDPRLLPCLRRRGRLRHRPRAVAASTRSASVGTARPTPHQHVSAAPSLTQLRRRRARLGARSEQAGVTAADIRYARHLRQLHHHADDPARGDRPRPARRGRQAAPRTATSPRRCPAAEHPWRPAQLRPLRRRRRDGASGRDAPPDDRPRRPTPGQGRVPGPAAWRRRRPLLACQPRPGAGRDDARTGPPARPPSLYQRCAACGTVWYFRRGFCPVCGSAGCPLRALGRARAVSMRSPTWRARPRRRAARPRALRHRPCRHGEKASA